MTDLIRVLPHFPTSQYANLIPALEKHQVTTSELLTLEAADLGKRTQLPLLDLKRLCSAVLDALHSDLGAAEDQGDKAAAAAGRDDSRTQDEEEEKHETPRHSFSSLKDRWKSISTLDPALDASLGGGIPTGYITELTGESGAGKTQFLLSLLLAVQLPPPHGTGRNALYISTEAPLSTRRLTQMLNNNPLFKTLPAGAPRPSLDNIISTTTPDLESQEHILTYQVPVEVERRGVGLIVLDSVAANYRAEFDRSAKNGPGGSARDGAAGQNMGARGAELVRLGMLLRDLARTHNLAVVVSNQVADRFDRGGSSASSAARKPLPPPPPSYGRAVAGGAGGAGAGRRGGHGESSPLASRSSNPEQAPMPYAEVTSSMAEALPPSSMSHGDNEDEGPPPPRQQALPPSPPSMADDMAGPQAPPALDFDHQQRWFTGWGDDPHPSSGLSLKTPSLGLVWSTQIACRVALFKAPRYGRSRYAEDDDVGVAGAPTLKTWRRWMKVVFAPHVAAMGPGLEGCAEFEIAMGGLKGITR